MRPARIMRTKRGNRFIPWVYTPSRVVSANRRAHSRARSSSKPSLRSAPATVSSSSPYGTLSTSPDAGRNLHRLPGHQRAGIILLEQVVDLRNLLLRELVHVAHI